MSHLIVKTLLALAGSIFLVSHPGAALADAGPATSIPTVDLVQPADLVLRLKAATVPKPLILQVGFRSLYLQAHIPDSVYVGAASEESGLQKLRTRVEGLAKDRPIVIYCGCCPWSHCPNIAAAYDELHKLGFTQVKVLYIADNFGDNWVNRGYPVSKGP